MSDFFRSDIREGRSGLPLTVNINVVNVNSSCSPVSGANVEIWQCDVDGHYSQYTQPGYNGQFQGAEPDIQSGRRRVLR
jgi:protocatechuate 3,4-dioxygenase beta subunit